MKKDWNLWSREIYDGVLSVKDEQLSLAADILSNVDLILTAGNGGSSALASHAAQAFMKPCYKAGMGVASVCLTDAVPTLTAHANDGGWASALMEVAVPYLKARCALLLVSSSGESDNVVSLATLAKQRGHKVVAMTGFVGGRLRQIADLCLHVGSRDYEVIEPVHDALLHRIQHHFSLRTVSSDQ